MLMGWLQAMTLQDPGFKFNTRQQAVQDMPWHDWEGCMFQPVS